MTMKHRDGIEIAKRTFDPEKDYEYTWPGQKPKTVKGKDLTDLCRGADPEALNIREAAIKAEREGVPVTLPTPTDASKK